MRTLSHLEALIFTGLLVGQLNCSPCFRSCVQRLVRRAVSLGKSLGRKRTRKNTAGRRVTVQRPIMEQVFSLKDFERGPGALPPWMPTGVNRSLGPETWMNLPPQKEHVFHRQLSEQ